MVNLAMLKAAFYKPHPVTGELPILPDYSLSKSLRINASHCEKYNKLVAWRLGIASVIHPNYLQVLTLPMQLSMMSSDPFPFKPMGLVHLANVIKVNKLPEQSATLQLKTSFSGLSWHKKGWVFAMLSEGFVDGQLAVSGTSFYLSRQNHTNARVESSAEVNGHFKDAENTDPEKHVSANLASDDFAALTNINEMTKSNYAVEIPMPAGLGRKYASVSGDFNPIHLSTWSAKSMGFRRAIAHGMYSKAICLSHVLKQAMADKTVSPITSQMQIFSQFMQPIYLPTKCELKVDNDDKQAHLTDNPNTLAKPMQEIDFSLISNVRSKRREHLRCNIILGQ